MGVPHDQMAVFRFSGFDFSLISRNVARPSLPRSGARAVLEGAARSGPVLEGVPAGVYGTVSGPSRGVGTFSDAQTLEKGYTYSSSIKRKASRMSPKPYSLGRPRLFYSICGHCPVDGVTS